MKTYKKVFEYKGYKLLRIINYNIFDDEIISNDTKHVVSHISLNDEIEFKESNTFPDRFYESYIGTNYAEIKFIEYVDELIYKSETENKILNSGFLLEKIENNIENLNKNKYSKIIEYKGFKLLVELYYNLVDVNNINKENYHILSYSSLSEKIKYNVIYNITDRGLIYNIQDENTKFNEIVDHYLYTPVSEQQLFDFGFSK